MGIPYVLGVGAPPAASLWEATGAKHLMTSDPHPHHRWGLQKGPPSRFPRDVAHPAMHGPARPRPEAPEVDQQTSIAASIAPQLHAVVDDTLERIAALQDEAVREARRDQQEAFEQLLVGLFRHSDGLGQIARSVSDLAASLRQELEQIDAAVAELTGASPTVDSAAPDSSPVAGP